MVDLKKMTAVLINDINRLATASMCMLRQHKEVSSILLKVASHLNYS